MLDEMVPVSVARTLQQNGHTAEFIRDYTPPGSPDPLVATISERMSAGISPRIPPPSMLKIFFIIFLPEINIAQFKNLDRFLPFAQVSGGNGQQARNQAGAHGGPLIAQRIAQVDKLCLRRSGKR